MLQLHFAPPLLLNIIVRLESEELLRAQSTMYLSCPFELTLCIIGKIKLSSIWLDFWDKMSIREEVEVQLQQQCSTLLQCTLSSAKSHCGPELLLQDVDNCN